VFSVSINEILKHVDREKLLRLTSDLVNIPSPTGEEKEIAEFYAAELDRIGLEVTLQEVEKDRPNVIAYLRGDGGGATLMFNGHMDTSITGKDKEITVSVPGQRPKAEVDGDWLYGLGASNMKNALAAYAVAAEALIKGGARIKGDLIIAAVVGEIEKAPVDQYQGPKYRGGGLGTLYAVTHGITADAAIIGEPTGMRVQIGNTGYVFAKISVKGVLQHTWSKEHGVDAIQKMVKVMKAVYDWEPEYQAKAKHPFMMPRISIGAIEGGFPYKPTFCPGFCNCYLHITMVPNQDPLEIKRDLEKLIADLRKDDPELDASVELYFMRKGYEIPENAYVARAVSRAHKAISGKEPERPSPYRYSVSSDGSILFNEAGIPSVTYGAGGISREPMKYSMYDGQRGEVVNIYNLAEVTKVYILAAMDICNQSPETVKSLSSSE